MTNAILKTDLTVDDVDHHQKKKKDTKVTEYTTILTGTNVNVTIKGTAPSLKNLVMDDILTLKLGREQTEIAPEKDEDEPEKTEG